MLQVGPQREDDRAGRKSVQEYGDGRRDVFGARPAQSEGIDLVSVFMINPTFMLLNISMCRSNSPLSMVDTRRILSLCWTKVKEAREGRKRGGTGMNRFRMLSSN